MMYTFVQSSVFEAWLLALADQKAKARILARLKSAALGNMGDCKPVGEGISEMRVHVGAGYRVYLYTDRQHGLCFVDGWEQGYTEKRH